MTTLVAASLGATGCLALKPDQDALVAKHASLEKRAEQDRAELRTLRADLDATRQRLDTALRASADRGDALVSSEQRLNALVGRLDEVAHGNEELKRELTATRDELSQRVDELKRAQLQQAAPLPSVPGDRTRHLAALDEAVARKEWAAVRVLAPEFVNRYPTDEKADDALFAVAQADMEEGRPVSALGSFNRFLKLYPKSARLDAVLLSMGNAYLALHDCDNAQSALSACEARFAKRATGKECAAKLATIKAKPPGLCAPK